MERRGWRGEALTSLRHWRACLTMIRSVWVFQGLFHSDMSFWASTSTPCVSTHGYTYKSETPTAVPPVPGFVALHSCLRSSAFGDSLAPCGQTASVPSSLSLELVGWF